MFQRYPLFIPFFVAFELILKYFTEPLTLLSFVTSLWNKILLLLLGFIDIYINIYIDKYIDKVKKHR